MRSLAFPPFFYRLRSEFNCARRSFTRALLWLTFFLRDLRPTDDAHWRFHFQCLTNASRYQPARAAPHLGRTVVDIDVERPCPFLCEAKDPKRVASWHQ